MLKDFRLGPESPVRQVLAGLAATGASVEARPGCSGVPVTPHDKIGRKPRRDLRLGFQHVGFDRQPGQDRRPARRAPAQATIAMWNPSAIATGS